MPEVSGQKGEQSDALQDLTGSTVGRFRIRARLGAGGMGEVYRAEDTKLKRPVALKRMAPHLRTDEHYRRRFLREAERASSLSYQYIAGVYDVLEENGEIFLVMEHVEGETLRERLKRPSSVEEFAPVAVQCAEALAAAHGKGIVHHDIKPANIMLTPAGQVKILDFGVAKRLARSEEETLTETGESTAGGLSGTPAYMAPEVLRGKEADGRSDIFSLGIVFYEALSGRHPFRTQTFVETADRILHEMPVPPSQVNSKVPVELDRIVGKMLAKEVGERYATAADLVVDLRAFERAQAAGGLRLAPTPAKITVGRRQVALLVVALILGLVSLLLWRWLAPVQPAQRIPVAVLPFANQTGDASLERARLMLTEMLLLDLSGSPNIQVLPYERLLEITRGFEAEGKDISSPEAIQAVAAYSNSQFVVVPTMFAVGRTVRVQAEFRDARSGETLSTTKVEATLSGSPEDTLYNLLGELTDRIQNHFKTLGRGEDYRPRPASSRPKSARAALYMNEARNAIARGDYDQALQAFHQVLEEDPEFPLTYAWMGQIYGLLGYDERARALSEKAAQLISPQTPLTDAYFIEANLAERKYDYSAAEQKYRELIRLYPDDAVWRVRLAEVYEGQGQYSEAIASYKEALRLDPNYIVASQQLGVLYGRTDDLPQALANGQTALRLYRALGNREGEASTLVDLAEIYRLQSDYPRARESAASALESFQGLKNEFGVLRATKVLGDINFGEGKYSEARRYYQQVLSTSGRIQNNKALVLTLMNTGVTYHREGDLTKAVDYYERSLAQEQLFGQYKDWPSLRGRAMALSNLGGILVEYGPEPDRGLRLVEEALPIFQRMKATWWEGHDRELVGLYFMNAGQFPKAEAQFRQAQELYRSIGNKGGLAQSAFSLGRCAFLQSDYEKARAFFADALAQFQSLKDQFWETYARIHLGWTYRRLGDSATARPLLEEALKAAENGDFGELLPDAYTALGELFDERGQKEQARQSFERSSALWKEPNVFESSIEARSYLALLRAGQGDFERALSDGRTSLAAAQKLQRTHTLARALINLAGVHVLRRQYAAALEVLGEIPLQHGLGPELRAQALAVRSRALEGLGRVDEASAAAQQAQDDILSIQRTLAPEHRESFAARRDLQVLLR